MKRQGSTLTDNRREKNVFSRQCEVFMNDRFLTVLVRFLYGVGGIKILSVVEQPNDELRHRLGNDVMEQLQSDCKKSMIREGVYHD